jgi:phage replication-related protein YjqB (UPF0714/DUF867 family)
MTERGAIVRKALLSQDDLRRHREHCSVDRRLLASVGAAVGGQIRIRRTATEYALYTVSEGRDEDRADVVRVGLPGRRRLGTDDPFDGAVVLPAADPSLSEADAETRGELVERLDDDGVHRGLIVIAPHGGDIEEHTDEQAEHVASCLRALGVSSWRCKGWKARRPDGTGGAFECWHTTSTDIDPSSFPGLAAVIDRGFTYAVAFHGFDEPEILIGGTAPAALKQEIKRALEAATSGSDICVRIATPGDVFGGDDPCNIVNRLTVRTAGGIQIEQSTEARRDHGTAIAGAIAAVYARSLPRPRPTWRASIDDLVGWVRDAARRVLDWGSRRRR